MDTNSLVPVESKSLVVPAKRTLQTIHGTALVAAVATWVSFFVGQITMLSTIGLSLLVLTLWVSSYVTTKLVQIFLRVRNSRRDAYHRNRFYRQVSERGLTREMSRWETQTEEVKTRQEQFILSLNGYLSQGELTYKRFIEAHSEALELVNQKLRRTKDLLSFALSADRQSINSGTGAELKNEIRGCLDESESLLAQLRQMHLQLINVFTESSQSQFLSTTQELDRLLVRIQSYSEVSSRGDRDEPSSI